MKGEEERREESCQAFPQKCVVVSGEKDSPSFSLCSATKVLDLFEVR